jgi:hypothetical protein
MTGSRTAGCPPIAGKVPFVYHETESDVMSPLLVRANFGSENAKAAQSTIDRSS